MENGNVKQDYPSTLRNVNLTPEQSEEFDRVNKEFSIARTRLEMLLGGAGGQYVNVFEQGELVMEAYLLLKHAERRAHEVRNEFFYANVPDVTEFATEVKS